MLRLHKGGVSSLQRALGIDPSHYCSMDDVFRSGAIDLQSMRNSWIDVITTEMTPYEVDGRLVFTGDGVLQPKEGRRQPGVTRHHKDSGTQTKPSSFHGIHAGCINILTKTNNGNLCATPLTAELMDGLAPTANWKNSKKPHANRRWSCRRLYVHRRLQIGFSIMESILLTEHPCAGIASESLMR